MDAEDQRLAALEEQIKKEWANPRFKNIQRPYTAKQVATLRQSIPISYASNIMAQKLFDLLENNRLNKRGSVTFGAMDPIQIANIAKYLDCVYVSGWQCSASCSTTNEPGPDFADYPADTVPNHVDRLFKSLLLQDRKQNQEFATMTPQERKETKRYDFLPPMIADADAGFGGPTSIMKLVKLFVEAGAAGIHIEDQRPGNKKCGHMGGKVVVSTREHVNRILACRLQADIMGNGLNIVARTDALGAKFIDNNVDPTDHPWILGVCPDGKQRTFPDEGRRIITSKGLGDNVMRQWNEKALEMGYAEAKKTASTLGFDLNIDYEVCRSDEGFYPFAGSVECCARRAREFLKYADLLWMETATPEVAVAKKLSDLVKVYHPEKFFAYNLSPSFNWSAVGMDDKAISTFCDDLGKCGYVFQFITLAGFHLDALKSEKLAKDFSKRRMIAYVEKVQRKEEKHDVDQYTHQKWSGANYVDSCLMLVQKNAGTLSTSSESTELQQFKKKK